MYLHINVESCYCKYICNMLFTNVTMHQKCNMFDKWPIYEYRLAHLLTPFKRILNPLGRSFITYAFPQW